MKKITWTSLFIVTGVIINLMNITQAQALFKKNIYDFKNAEIILHTTSPLAVIEQKVSIGEHGKYVKEETTTHINVLGIKREDTQTSYSDNVKHLVYTYNPGTNEATAMDISEMTEGIENRQMYEFNKENIEKFGGKILREETYKSLACTVVEFPEFMSTIWFHKKYPVRMINNAAGIEMKTELISFKEGAAKDYKLPNTAKFGEVQKMENTSDQMQAYKNDPEYQEYLKAKRANQSPSVNSAEYQDVMQQLQNNPEYQEALQQIQNNPEFQKAMQQAAEAKTQSQNDSATITEKAGDIIKEETEDAAEEAIRDTTKKGMKKLFSGALNSIF